MVRMGAGDGWYRAIFENSPHGIILFDKRDFTIRETNAAFSTLLNYPPGELHGRYFTSLFSDRKEKQRFLKLIGQEPEIPHIKTLLATKEGNDCDVDLSWNTLNDMIVVCTATDISRHKISIKPVDRDLANCKHLTENLPTGILIVRDGIIQYANPAFLDFLQYLPDEIPGRDLLSLIDNPDPEDSKEFVRHGLKIPADAVRSEFHFVTKYGNKRLALLFTLPVIHSGEKATLINVIDISERQLLEEKIQLDNERRRGIIVTVAHELRTPLQPILGYLNLLIQDPEGFGIHEDTKRILERCLASVDRERQIINQMLELSVLDSGKLHLNLSKFSLLLLINSVLDSGEYRTKAEIITGIPINLRVHADMERLFGVFDSLLSNAVNFSRPPRKISVFYRSAPGDIFHHISVMDNGTGISENALSSIFEPFQLADAAKLSRRFDRIGLSLSMAKKIMQMHGGDITVESRLHTGSTFTLHIPKSPQEAPR